MDLNEIYKKVEDYNKEINQRFIEFINKCSYFEKYYNHEYEIQKTLEMNKIFFQCYISESDICYYLKEQNHTEDSLENLKKVMKDYGNNSGINLESYYEAIDLCQMVDDLEELIDSKIEYEMNVIYEYSKLIENIETINSNKYEELYIQIKREITDNYLDKDVVDKNNMSIIIHILNDIFNYFVSGYPDIPDEYLSVNNSIE